MHSSRFRSGRAGSASAGDHACQRCRDPEVNDPTRRPPGGLARPHGSLRRKSGKTVGCTACQQAGAANAQRSCGTATPARQLVERLRPLWAGAELRGQDGILGPDGLCGCVSSAYATPAGLAPNHCCENKRGSVSVRPLGLMSCDCTQCAGCCSARGLQSMSDKPQACRSARDGGRSPDDVANNHRHSHISESIYAIIRQ